MDAPKSDELRAAEWVVVAFVKAWSMKMLRVHLDSIGLGRHFEFLPRNPYWWGSNPVRSFVASEWPKLNAFLITAIPEKQIAAAKEIVKLRSTIDRPLGALTSQEYSEVNKSRQELRRATTAHGYSRKLFKTNQRSAWSVCK